MIIVVTGPTRSGKSVVAEQIASTSTTTVTYVATADVADDDMAARVELHRERRPEAWSTVDSGADLAATIDDLSGTLLVDSIGTWIARTWDGESFAPDIDALVAAVTARTGDTIIVAEQVGWSTHAADAATRRWVDLVGEATRRLADVADRVLLVVAGRAVDLVDTALPSLAEGPR